MASSTDSVAIEDQIARLRPEERGPAAAFLAENPPGAGAPVAVVIPAYNEAPTVADVIRRIPSELAGHATEVIVIHERIATPASRTGHEAGWVECLDGLAALLAP